MNKTTIKPALIAESEKRVRALMHPKEDVATTRKCLVCGRSFESEGWHHRPCTQCRKRS